MREAFEESEQSQRIKARGSVFLGVEAEVLFDTVEASAMMIDRYGDCVNIFAHTDELRLNAVECLGKNADLSLGLLVAHSGFCAHFLEKSNCMVFKCFRHLIMYIVKAVETPVFYARL